MKKILAAICISFLVPSLAMAGMADKVVRKRVAGIDILIYPTTIKGVVTLRGALPGGDALAINHNDNPAVAQLTANLLDRGTEKEDKFAVARKLEGTGAQLFFSARRQEVRIEGKFLTNQMPLVVTLLAEQLRTPAFSDVEFEKAKQEFIGEQKNYLTDPQARAYTAFFNGVFPADHPNHELPIDDYIAAAEKLTVAEVRAFHRRVYGPDHMILVFVGDVDVAAIEAAVASSFNGWSGGVDYLRSAPGQSEQAGSKQANVDIPAKTSSVITLGERTGLRAADADTLPLTVGTAILGDGFTGRLMRTVRDREGLTYGISASIGEDSFVDGNWAVKATFAPELLNRGIASTEREVRLWWDKGVTDEELAARKTNLIGSYQVSLARTFGVANRILSIALSNRDVSWLDMYPTSIAAVTKSEVNEAIKRHLDPNQMMLVKAGTLSQAAAK